MTAIRDRKSDPDAADDDAVIPWDERSIVGARRGLPWWGAVLLALGMAVLGAIVDLQVSNALGGLFQGFFLAGSVIAVGAVRRRNLFGPMVQPPLIQAVTVPTMVLVASGLPSSSDTLAKVLAISTPLINGFPMMAITTGITVAIGVYRLFRERDPDAPSKVREKGKRTEDEPPEDAPRTPRATGGRRGLGRRSAGDDVSPDEPTEAARPAAERPAKGRAAEKRGQPRRGGTAGAAGAAGAMGKRSRSAPDEPRRAEEPRRGRERRPGRDAGPRDGGPREGGAREGGPREPGPPAGGKAPRDPGGRPPRQRPQMPPDAAERRRRAEEWPDSIPGPKRPRRRPTGGEDPPPRRPSAPRRDPGRGERPPRRNRPWDDERD